MGLLSTEAKLNIVRKTVKYYENKGYIIPKIVSKSGRKIYDLPYTLTVKVNDLSPTCGAKVLTDCDECGRLYNMPFNMYYRQNHEGKTYCQKCYSKLFRSGENHHNWNIDKTQEERINGRNYPEYIDFVKSVMARDNYICKCCGNKATDVHHLYGYAGFPEYRIDQTQAISLCNNCHKSFHCWHTEQFGYDNRGKCTKDDFERWLGSYLDGLYKYEGVLPTCQKVIDMDTLVIYNSVTEVGNALNLNYSNIYRCCERIAKACKGRHFLYYHDYLKLSKRELDKYYEWCNNSSTKNICLNTLMVFDKFIDANNYYELSEYNTQIKKCCKGEIDFVVINNKALCWMYYSDYVYFINNGGDIDKYIEEKTISQKIICLTTGKVFLNSSEAYSFYNIKTYHIKECCDKKRKSCGFLSDGTPLHWMYYVEYLKLSKEELDKYLYSVNRIETNKIVCLNNLNIFISGKDASKWCGLKTADKIIECCRGRAKSAGKLSDGTPLRWMYYEDYLNLSNEEKQELENKYKIKNIESEVA